VAFAFTVATAFATGVTGCAGIAAKFFSVFLDTVSGGHFAFAIRTGAGIGICIHISIPEHTLMYLSIVFLSVATSLINEF